MNQTVIRKKRILILCDYLVETGFSTVLTNIFREIDNYFGDKYQYDIIACNWYGDKLPDDYEIKIEEAADIKRVVEYERGETKEVVRRITKSINPYTKVFSAYYHDGREDVFGRNAALSFLRHIDYDLFFIINDIGVVTPMLEVIRKIREDMKSTNRKKFKILYYFPKDHSSYFPGSYNNMEVADRLIAYTDYARNLLKSHSPITKQVGRIYHGVDIYTFRKLSYVDRQEFRQSFFGRSNSDKFIISNINRNQHRKDIPSTILSFVEFKKKVRNSFLYLHMDPLDEKGWNLPKIFAQTELVAGVDYMFTPESMIKEKPDQGFMNCIYNASDVYLTTTHGEGFGLTVLEAMAAETPVIAPKHTAIAEIGQNKIAMLKEFSNHVNLSDNIIRPIVCVEEVVENLVEIFNHPEDNKFAARMIRDYVKDFFSWKHIGQLWIEEFKKIL